MKLRFILSLGMFLVSGCAYTQPVSLIQQPTEEFIIEGLCDNPLFPVKQNATWTYSVSGNENFNYTETITEVKSSGFTITSQRDQSTSTQEWICETGGLKALQINSEIYAIPRSATIVVSGVSLPKEIISGMQWLYSLKLEQGTYTIIMQEMGSESITIPSGTFNATKFQADHQFESTDTSLNFINSSTVWYSPSIGLIKSVDTIEKIDGAFTITTELISYSIP